ERAQKAERERTVELVKARVAEAHASRFSRRAGQRFGTLEAIREAVKLTPELDLPPTRLAELHNELRNLAITALTLPDVRPTERRLVLTHPGMAAGAAFRPDNRQVVVGLTDGRISLFTLPEGTLVRTWPALAPIVRPTERRSGIDFGSERLVSLRLGSVVQVR